MLPSWLRLMALAVATVGVGVLCIGVGTTSINPLAAFGDDPLIMQVRFPRVLLGAFAGAGLAGAGVTFQALLRNPLADPYIVGVSGGAALGGVIALVAGITGALTLPLFSFGGAVLSTALLFGLARSRGRTDPLTLLLVGVVFNAFAAAVVTFLKTVVTATKAQELLFWLMGTIGVEAPRTLWIVGVYIVIASVALSVGSGVLNILSMGDEDAAALGLPVERARLLCFTAAAMLVGTVVAVCGMIGFVGLVIPHTLRRLIGADHRHLVPASLLGGAIFLMVADAVARLTFYAFGTEIPVGAVTAFTGGPFFLALLLRRG